MTNSGEIDCKADEPESGATPSNSDLAALVSNEAEQRVRNMLGVVRSVFRRTIEGAESPEQAISHFQGRLEALARHQAGSVGPASDSTDLLENAIREELLSVGPGDASQVSIEGQDVSLTSLQMTWFGLTIHELVTNSIKFGVLSSSGGSGRVRIAWTAVDGTLRWEWVETGVPIDAAGQHRHGLGREVVEQALPYQLQATTSFQLTNDGVRCPISLPLT